MKRFSKYILTFLGLCLFSGPTKASQDFAEAVSRQLRDLNFTDQDYAKIVAYVAGNEFQNNPEGAIDWNDGEAFASLGIGHFIWYPKDVEQRFTESFPKMARFLLQNWPDESSLNDEARSHYRYARNFFYTRDEVRFCPWNTKTEFLKWKRENPHGWSSLIFFLNHAPVKRIQVDYLNADFQMSLVALIDDLQGEENLRAMEALEGITLAQVIDIERHTILNLLQSKAGATALMDYTNFKGDGIDTRMRYQSVGWGLQQVLFWAQSSEQSALSNLQAFSRAALRTLLRRSELASNPIERDQWIHGWANRVLGYGFRDTDMEIKEMKKERRSDGTLKWPKLFIGSRALRDIFEP